VYAHPQGLGENRSYLNFLNGLGVGLGILSPNFTYGAFTLDAKSTLNENLGGILGGTQC
jgi:hypothetical protein